MANTNLNHVTNIASRATERCVTTPKVIFLLLTFNSCSANNVNNEWSNNSLNIVVAATGNSTTKKLIL